MTVAFLCVYYFLYSANRNIRYHLPTRLHDMYKVDTNFMGSDKSFFHYHCLG